METLLNILLASALFALFLALLGAMTLLVVVVAEEITKIWRRESSRLDQPFATGDVVRLKSGGPKMVLSHYDDCRGWFCKWFSTENEYIILCIQAELLKRV